MEIRIRATSDANNSTALDSVARTRVDTQLPSLTFDEGFTIELGGRRVELRYHGPNDGRGSIRLMVPDQDVLSVVDWVVIGRMPYRDLARYNVDGTIRSLHEVEAMDFRVASPRATRGSARNPASRCCGAIWRRRAKASSRASW